MCSLPTHDKKPILALEIGPLAELHHTGISNVTKRLAIELLCDNDVEGQFFFHRSMIPRNLVEKIVQLDGCPMLRWALGRCAFPSEALDDGDRPLAAIYTNHKWHRRLFPFEAL